MGFKGFGLIGPFQGFARISYAAYILHYPLLIDGAYLLPYWPRAMTYVVLFGALCGISYLAETHLQEWAGRVLSRSRAILLRPALSWSAG
jgi:peptidoglycan/LPS O-acetylase OafA/YrhL